MPKNKLGPMIKNPQIQRTKRYPKPPGIPARQNEVTPGGSFVYLTYKKFTGKSIINGS